MVFFNFREYPEVHRACQNALIPGLNFYRSSPSMFH
jgi:hypothetical protein